MKSNLEKQAEYAEILFQENNHVLTDQVVYALFLCFTPDELCELYIEKISSTQFRRKLQKHILLSIKKNGSEQFIPFLVKLFELLAPYKSQRSIWINALIYRIILDFPVTYIEKYFEILLQSHRENDRVRAYVLAGEIWSDKIETLLWRKWNENKPEQCLITLIKHGDVNNLKRNFELVWDDKQIPVRIKRSILFRIIKNDFTFAEKIRETHPITYLYCAAKISKHL
jgi:hypothetical protein